MVAILSRLWETAWDTLQHLADRGLCILLHMLFGVILFSRQHSPDVGLTILLSPSVTILMNTYGLMLLLYATQLCKISVHINVDVFSVQQQYGTWYRVDLMHTWYVPMAHSIISQFFQCIITSLMNLFLRVIPIGTLPVSITACFICLVFFEYFHISNNVTAERPSNKRRTQIYVPCDK